MCGILCPRQGGGHQDAPSRSRAGDAAIEKLTGISATREERTRLDARHDGHDSGYERSGRGGCRSTGDGDPYRRFVQMYGDGCWAWTKIQRPRGAEGVARLQERHAGHQNSRFRTATLDAPVPQRQAGEPYAPGDGLNNIPAEWGNGAAGWSTWAPSRDGHAARVKPLQRRVPDQRAGRGRRGRHPHPAVELRWAVGPNVLRKLARTARRGHADGFRAGRDSAPSPIERFRTGHHQRQAHRPAMVDRDGHAATTVPCCVFFAELDADKKVLRSQKGLPGQRGSILVPHRDFA